MSRSFASVPRIALVPVAVAACSAWAAAQSGQAPPPGADLAERLRALEARVQQLEGAEVVAAPGERPLIRHEATDSTPKGFWAVPGSDLKIKVGGYTKLDVIHDWQDVGNRYKFATNTIAVPTDDRRQTTLHARESRLFLDARSDLDGLPTRVYVEGDFFGDGNGFELRHAYGEWGGLLAGQTWTTFMDLSSRPHTLDFEGPDAELFIRNPMLRWTQPVGAGWSYAVAIEQASQQLSGPGGAPLPGAAVTRLPDFTAHIRHERDGWHGQLATVLRQISFEADPAAAAAATAADDETFGFGVALSGHTRLGDPGRRLMGQVSYGEGYAYYNQSLRGSDSDAVYTPAGLEALTAFTAVLGYEHDWSERWTSTVAWSMARVDDLPTQATDALHATQSASVNLCWQPSPRILTGVEYLYGFREDASRERGEAHRLQFSFKFLF